MAPISSTLSLFLPLTGGYLTGNLTGTTIAATYISASNVSASMFASSGENIFNLDYNKIQDLTHFFRMSFPNDSDKSNSSE